MTDATGTVSKEFRCPVCSVGSLLVVDIPSKEVQLFTCTDCKEMFQLVGKEFRPIGDALKAHAFGEDRITAAISKSPPTTLNSFIDKVEAAQRNFTFEFGAMTGSLREMLARAENRLEVGISLLGKYALADDDAQRGLDAIREGRDILRAHPRR